MKGSHLTVVAMGLSFLLIFLFAEPVHQNVYGQLDKLKKAAEKDKKDKESKKTDKKTEKKKEVKKTDKKEEGDTAKEDTEAQKSDEQAAEKAVHDDAVKNEQKTSGRSIEDCDDTRSAKGYLYWIEQNLTTYDNAYKAQEYVEKTQEALKKAKTSCSDVDVSSIVTKLADLQKQVDVKLGAEKAKENAEKLLQKASFAFGPILDNMLYNGYVGMFTKKETAQKLYDECVKLDFVSFKKQVEEVLAGNAELKKKATDTYGEYTTLMSNYSKFEEQVNTFLVNEINQAVEEAYAQKAKGKNNLNNALEAAEAAELTAKAVLLVIPAHAKTAQLLKDAQSVVAAVEKEFGGSIFTSAYHKENAGKIVFSKSPITIKAENPAAMTKDFLASDYIYAMAYLKGPIESLAYNWECAVRIYVDDAEKMYRRFKASEQSRKQTWMDLEIVPDAATSVQFGGTEYSKALAGVSPRNHTVRVEFWDTDFTKLLASGEFNLDATQGMETLEKNAKLLSQKLLDKVRMPAAGMKNASFEQKIMSDWNNDRYKALRAVITSNDWSIQRNAITSVIEHRYIWCAVAVKTTDGDCKIFYVSYKQDYTGGGYGSLNSWGMGDSELINCDNVMK